MFKNIAALDHNGDLLFLRKNDIIFKMIVRDDGYEHHVINTIKAFVKEGMACIDLGANIGIHTMTMSNAVGAKGKVYAFEPQMPVYHNLCTNIFLNNMNNVIAYPYAAFSRSCTFIEMRKVDYDQEGVSAGDIGLGTGGDKCLGMAIDDLGLGQIDFIKIDVQGAEPFSIEGAQKTIAQCRPIMIVEIEEHHLRRLGSSSLNLINMMLKMDYSLFRVVNQYPCDHLAIPNEKIEEYRMNLDSIGYPLELISGASIKEVLFDGQKPYSWAIYDRIVQ
jgi:FkbM family methyltransferase